MPRLALERLSQFHISHKLQNAVLTFIASQLSEIEDFQDINEMFRLLDKNGDGKISKDELALVYEKKGLSILKGSTEQIMIECDINKSGYIDYTEFLVACRKKELIESVKNLEAAFRYFDIDKNGKISAFELREMLGDEGAKHTSWSKLIQEVDLNGDGELDINEFKIMMLDMLSK